MNAHHGFDSVENRSFLEGGCFVIKKCRSGHRPASFAALRASGTLSAILGALLGIAPAARAQEVTEFSIPGGAVAAFITVGPDGNLWFTEPDANKIGRITLEGAIQEFPIPTAASGPLGITAGPDGNLWFTESGANKIARMTPDGAVVEFAVPTPASIPVGIAAGPDGKLWFTEENGNKVGRITVEGVVDAEFLIPRAVCLPRDIVAGVDGNLWFTGSDALIGRVTPAGVITEYATPINASLPHGITNGPDGNIWFVEGQGQSVARATPFIIEYPVDVNVLAYPMGIASGPDGNLWFTANRPNIGRMTTAGVVTAFPLPDPNAQAGGIVAGPDGNLWFTETVGDGSGRIGRITTGQCVADRATLCLAGGRFRVTADWKVPSLNETGHGRAVPVAAGSGYFWFFNAGEIDLAVKVIDGCAVNGHYWFFAGGLTNVEVKLDVRDAGGGTTQTYTNPAGVAFAPVQSSTAFPCQ